MEYDCKHWPIFWEVGYEFGLDTDLFMDPRAEAQYQRWLYTPSLSSQVNAFVPLGD